MRFGPQNSTGSHYHTINVRRLKPTGFIPYGNARIISEIQLNTLKGKRDMTLLETGHMLLEDAVESSGPRSTFFTKCLVSSLAHNLLVFKDFELNFGHDVRNPPTMWPGEFERDTFIVGRRARLSIFVGGRGISSSGGYNSQTIGPILMKFGMHLHRIHTNHPVGAGVACPFMVGMKSKTVTVDSLTFGLG